MTTIQSARGELGITPERGGCVSAFRWDGVDILRPFDAAHGANAPATAYAAFPLVPFSGRIANGVFSFEGKDYAIPANFPPESHAIHGQGWQSEWNIADQSNQSVKLSLRYVGAHWPWAYEAAQTFSIVENGLKVELALTNLSERAMPGGIGWHPYFPAHGANLLADVSAVWLSGEDMIPGAPSPLARESDLRSVRAVSDLKLDNAFAAGPVGTKIAWEDRGVQIRMTSSETLRHLIIFTPPGEDFFCVEPVSHSPDAVNSAEPASITGLRILQSGETLSGTIRLHVDT